MPAVVLAKVRRPGIAPPRLRRVLAHVLRRHHAPRRAQVTVALVSDRAIRALNRRFLRKDRSTDVLAFPGGDRLFLGEVVVSVDRARAQAKTAGHDPATEIALLAAHGLLHLLGYDDRTAARRARMMRRQRRLLHELGFEVRG
jgi:probable rRNA maturation factor